MKISESPEKVINPAKKKAYRIYDERGRANADLLALEDEHIQVGQSLVLRHPSRATESRQIDSIVEIETLHIEVMHEGNILSQPASIQEMRERCQADIERLDPGVRRIVNPHIYHVSLSQKLWDLKQKIMIELKK